MPHTTTNRRIKIRTKEDNDLSFYTLFFKKYFRRTIKFLSLERAAQDLANLSFTTSAKDIKAKNSFYSVFCCCCCGDGVLSTAGRMHLHCLIHDLGPYKHVRSFPLFWAQNGSAPSFVLYLSPIIK